MSKSQWVTFSFWSAALGFVALTVWAATGRYLPGEEELLLWIVTHRCSVLTQLALVVSALGSINAILPLWVICMAVWMFRRQRILVLGFLPIPLGYPLYLVLKGWVARPSPDPARFLWLYDHPLGYFVESWLHRGLEALPLPGPEIQTIGSPTTTQAVERVIASGYPSGHALMSMIFYGTLAWWFWRTAAHGSVRWLWTGICLALAGLVGIARVYMGVHYPSDVLGAWLLAILFVVFASQWTKAIEARISAHQS